MAGPRTPTKVLELRGAFDKHPERKSERSGEPKPKGNLGQPPKRLSAGAKTAWREFAKHAPEGVFGDSDRVAVEIASVLLAEFREDPAEFSAARMARLDSLLGRFGMTPADRSKVVVDKKADDADPWADL